MDKATEEEEIAAIDLELRQIEARIVKLQDKKEFLNQRKDKLKELILKRRSDRLATKDWSSKNFPWSQKVEKTLKDVFNLTGFRPMQLEAINATLSKEDAILIMPTGSGKSLCYQLPALIDSGITLVVSPLVSLMEDQIMGLKRIKYPALMLSANTSKENAKLVSQALLDPKSTYKLIYVTPEKLAKSKRFMSQLQKCSAQGRFSRLAVDEVHCCSVWGHDFRPDYNYLGILKDMFPNTPLLGLTATSTSKVTADVQKMLNIRGCLVLKSSFNRPNLFYEVILKPPTQDECMDLLEDWLKHRFRDQTGIIYTTAIKDCEELTKELKKRNLRIGIYHAMLEPEVRTKMHSQWMDGTLQAVVATIAFGLGIDKPDVRFVIHHSLSKSMENFYQESGRAGRDGQRSECIVMFRLADVFKLSTMVFTQQTGLENLYGMLNYCLDKYQCRRSLIAEHFDEVWEPESCNMMCDHCKSPRPFRDWDVTEHCRSLGKIIDHAAALDVKLTVIKMLDAWYSKGDMKLRVAEVKRPSFERTMAEKLVGYLLIKAYLKEDFHYTAYSTISYLKKGQRFVLLDDKNHRVILTFGKPSQNGTVANPSKKEKKSVEPAKEKKSKSSQVDKNDKSSSTRVDKNDKSSSTRVDKNDKSSSTRADKNDKGSSTRVDKNDKGSSTRVDKNDKSSEARVDKNDKSNGTGVGKIEKSSGPRVDKIDKSSGAGVDKNDKSSGAGIGKNDKSSGAGVGKNDKSSGAGVDKNDKSSNARVDKNDKSSGARVDKNDKSSGARVDKNDKSSGAGVDKNDKSSGARVDKNDKSSGASSSRSISGSRKKKSSENTNNSSPSGDDVDITVIDNKIPKQSHSNDDDDDDDVIIVESKVSKRKSDSPFDSPISVKKRKN